MKSLLSWLAFLSLFSGSFAFASDCPNLSGTFFVADPQSTIKSITLAQKECEEVIFLYTNKDNTESEVYFLTDGVPYPIQGEDSLSVFYRRDMLVMVGMTGASNRVTGRRYYSIDDYGNLKMVRTFFDTNGNLIDTQLARAIRQQ